MSAHCFTRCTLRLAWPVPRHALSSHTQGFRPMDTLLTYCGQRMPFSASGGGTSSSNAFTQFGSGEQNTYQCDVITLLTKPQVPPEPFYTPPSPPPPLAVAFRSLPHSPTSPATFLLPWRTLPYPTPPSACAGVLRAVPGRPARPGQRVLPRPRAHRQPARQGYLPQQLPGEAPSPSNEACRPPVVCASSQAPV